MPSALDILMKLQSSPSDDFQDVDNIPLVLRKVVRALVSGLQGPSRYHAEAGVSLIRPDSGWLSVRHGSIFSGSGFGVRAAKEVLAQISPGYTARNVLCVEKVAWKRRWIMAHDPPEVMVKNAEELGGDDGDFVFNHITKKKCKIPRVDILDVGFSCKNFSAQNMHNKNGEFDEAISSGKGESGSTANMAFAFIAKTLPKIVLLENVPGLLKGFATGGFVNPSSNLCVLRKRLQELGYCCPWHILRPSPVVEASRNRVWLPCVYIGDRVNQYIPLPHHMPSGFAKLCLCCMEETADCVVPFDELQTIAMDHEDSEFWISHAQGELPKQSKRGRKGEKWRKKHCIMYELEGLNWPPRFSEELEACGRDSGLFQRQIEILHYLDAVQPMSQLCCTEGIVDLNLSIDRVETHVRCVPVIQPKSHLWLRNAKCRRTAAEAFIITTT